MGGFSNPFDVPLNSEIEESRQRQQASQAANGNPFDEPLASEVAERAHTEAKQHLSDNGNPFDVPLDSEIAEQKTQQEASKPNLVDKWIANPSTVPNARIRNLPNPAEGMTPGQALTNGVKTGAELGAIPASAIGLGEAAPIIGHLAESLPTLDKAYKVLKAVGSVTSGAGGTLYTLQHLKDVLKIMGGNSK